MSLAMHPRAYATVTGPHATFVSTEGRTEQVAATGDEDIRQAVVRRAADEARRTGIPLELITAGDRGEHRLLVCTDGRVEHLDEASPAPHLFTEEEVPASATRSRRDPAVRDPQLRREVTHDAPRPAAQPDSSPATELPARPTFLTPSSTAVPATGGWRGILARAGINVRPPQAEQRRTIWTAAVSRHWAGCRTVAIANGKGGVGKTMSTAMLTAVFARNGGGNVLAWDNNDTRGTLGWRTEQGSYDTTLRDLLPAADALLDASAGVSDVAKFVHHQGVDRYDVLRSNPELLAADQRITADQFDLLLKVAARYYRLVVFDSGNDESADRWRRMIDCSDQLVVPTLATPESAESAALLLDALRKRDERSAHLAQNAVVVVTQSERSSATAVRRIADGFAEIVREVEIIPFDPALKSGPLRFDALRPATRDAWLAAAASTAEGL